MRVDGRTSTGRGPHENPATDIVLTHVPLDVLAQRQARYHVDKVEVETLSSTRCQFTVCLCARQNPSITARRED